MLSLGLHRVWKRAAVRWAGATAGHTALDVCCGSGDLAFRLADAVGDTGKVCPALSLPGRNPDWEAPKLVACGTEIISRIMSRLVTWRC